MAFKPKAETSDSAPSYRRLISGGGLLFSFRIGGAVITYATQVALARWLGSEALGFYVEAFSWALIISILVSGGLSAGVMPFCSKYLAQREFGALRGYIARSHSIGLVSSILVSLLIGWTIWEFDLLNDGGSRTTLMLALACVPGLSMLRMDGRVSHAMSWFKLAFFPNSVLRPILFLAALAVARQWGWLDSASATMFLHLVVIVLVAACLNVVVRRNINRTVPEADQQYHTRIWLRTAAPLTLITLFSAFFAEVNIVVGSIFVPAEDIAVFNAAFRTAMLIGFGLMAIDSFNMPKVMAHFSRSELPRLEVVLRHAARLKSIGALSGLVFFVVFGRWILQIFGDEFVAGFAPLIILALGQLVRGTIGPVGELMAYSGHQDRCLVVYAAGIGGIVVAQAALMPVFGIVGGAIAATSVIVLTDLWLLRALIRLTGVNPSLFGRPTKEH